MMLARAQEVDDYKIAWTEDNSTKDQVPSDQWAQSRFPTTPVRHSVDTEYL